MPKNPIVFQVFMPDVNVRDSSQLKFTRKQLKLMMRLSNLPIEYWLFIRDLLRNRDEVMVIGPVYYGSAIARWIAAENFIDRLDGMSLKDIAAKDSSTEKAVYKRLDKLRDAFVFSLTGGTTLMDRGRAFLRLREAEWEDLEIRNALRNSIRRLRSYAQVAEQNRRIQRSSQAGFQGQTGARDPWLKTMSGQEQLR